MTAGATPRRRPVPPKRAPQRRRRSGRKARGIAAEGTGAKLRKRIRDAGASAKAAARTPRGLVALVAVALVAIGVAGLTAALRAGPGFPRIAFAEARGDAAALRAAVTDSIRGGTLARSLAPGAGDGIAEELHDAPAIFLSVVTDPEDRETPVEASQRILVTNTSRTELADVRLHVLAPEAGGQVEVVEAEIDGRPAQSRLEGTTLVVEGPGGFGPGDSVVVDLQWRLRPRILAESDSIDPYELLNPPEESLAFSPQLLRRNLMYLFDWYPRPERLGDSGWIPMRTDPRLADTQGPAGSVMLEIDRPEGWGAAASGARVGGSEGDGRVREQFALAGSRVGALVLQRNTVEHRVGKGEFEATGFGLDRFGPAVADAAANALYAKAALSELAGRTRWRQVHVVGLVFAGEDVSFTADDMILIRQDVLARGAPATGPGTQTSEYRQAAFEGASAEWWGGAVEVDATSHLWLRGGVRRYSAALVWRRVGGEAAAREITVGSARRYREARERGAADVPADVPAGTYTDAPEQAIAAAKCTLVGPALASAATGDGPQAFTSAAAIFAATSDESTLDPEALAAGAAGAGLDAASAAGLVDTWLHESEGDATIGLADGAGTIPYWTDGPAVAADVGLRTSFPIDLDTISGAGPGW